MKFLITGGLGFIGFALIRFLLSHTKHELLNEDGLTHASGDNPVLFEKTNERYDSEKVDIFEQTLMEEIVFGFRPDIVIHLAAETHVERSIESF
jgi:dTDP-glucose 4,6-dehydratase